MGLRPLPPDHGGRRIVEWFDLGRASKSAQMRFGRSGRTSSLSAVVRIRSRGSRGLAVTLWPTAPRRDGRHSPASRAAWQRLTRSDRNRAPRISHEPPTPKDGPRARGRSSAVITRGPHPWMFVALILVPGAVSLSCRGRGVVPVPAADAGSCLDLGCAAPRPPRPGRHRRHRPRPRDRR